MFSHRYMAEIVRLPKLGLSDWGEITEWHVEPGDHVEAGEVIAVLESDKSVVDIEATATGAVLTRYVTEGDEIAIEPGRAIAAIGEEGESAPDRSALSETPEPTPDSDRETERSGSAASSTSEGKVSPRARKLAEEHGVDPGSVTGTGPDGAVTASDVEEYAESEPAASKGSDSPPSEPAPLDDASGRPSTSGNARMTPRAKRYASDRSVDVEAIDGTGPKGAVTESDIRSHLDGSDAGADFDMGGDLTVSEVRDLSRLQRTVADRLAASAKEKPHVSGSRTISVEAVERTVAELSEGDDDVGRSDLLVRAVARALEAHPDLNALYRDDEYQLIDEINIGYAVDTDRGLIVPVIPEAGERSLAELAAVKRSAVERALDGTHDSEDLRGGTFTVTNVGALGLDTSFSIIDPPQVAILAIGRRTPELFDRDGEFVVEPAMTFSLIVDHRVLDGGDAGAFLETLRRYVENPSILLTE